jgi:hypothetical protein
MSTTNITFNPATTSSPQTSFLVESQGYVQGVYWDDPATKQWLFSGLVSSSNTTILWGGIPVEIIVPALGSDQQGNSVLMATTNSNIQAFTVMNQAYNGPMTPGGPPQYQVGFSIAYFLMGSNARIAVPISSALEAAVSGGTIAQQVSWNFTNNNLDVFNTTALACKVLQVRRQSKLISYNSGTGVLSWTTGAAAMIMI